MKTACIIQGNIRKNTDLVCKEMLRHFDVVIISTWSGEELDLTELNKCEIIYNEYPKSSGINNRNYQRLSTAKGIKRAKELNCDFVMKWRTDMLPLQFNIKDFIEKSLYQVSEGFHSRIVTCAFRCLSVKYDLFSSIPDIFAFGHISMMELLWGDDNFDYNGNFNLPSELSLKQLKKIIDVDINKTYCSETELYALFKEKLCITLGKTLTHEEILKQFFYLIDHKSLNIIWFGNNRFRSIIAIYMPWWTTKVWHGKKKVKVIGINYPSTWIWDKISPYVTHIYALIGNKVQEVKFKKYLKYNDINCNSRAYKQS